MRPDLSLRPLRPKDAHAVVRLVVDHGLFPPWMVPLPSDYEYLAIAHAGISFVAVDGADRLVGYVAGMHWHWDGSKESLTSYDALTSSPAWLRWLARSPLRRVLFHLARLRLRRPNATVLLAMGIAPAHRGRRLASRFLQAVQEAAVALGREHVVAPFRPSGYGDYKLGVQRGDYPTAWSFAEYCEATRDDGQPVDPWLRSLSRQGAAFLRCEGQSMRIAVPSSDFLRFRHTFRPAAWFQTSPTHWECGEAGAWTVDAEKDHATYIEPNVWGRLPVTRRPKLPGE